MPAPASCSESNYSVGYHLPLFIATDTVALDVLILSRYPDCKTSNYQEDEEVAAEDEEDMGVIETYSNYKPVKLQVGKPHPDPVVETASLASVEPPDIW